MALLGTILGSAAAAGTTYGLSRLFGSDSAPNIAPVAAPTVGQVLDVSERDRLAQEISRAFGGQADLVRGLRAQVQPGFGRLTESRVRGIRDAGRRAVGDLRKNLAQRRVLGSSFAGDALARQELAIASQEDAIRADAFLRELQLSNQLIDSEFGLRRGEFETLLNEETFRDKISAQFASAAFNAQSAAQRQQALFASQRQSDLIGLLKPLAGTAAKFAGSFGSNLASGGLASPSFTATAI